MQTTIKSAIGFEGAGLHTGRRARVTLRPASAEFGIWFRRMDSDGKDGLIAARWDTVTRRSFAPGSRTRPAFRS
jgi:UDP-3-O-[3-hydroxymyristoyl] N-acetylglucosamine deacetylase